MRVLITTYGFPTLAHAFVENYVLALTALGVDVGVVASADGDHPVEIAAEPRSGIAHDHPGVAETVRVSRRCSHCRGRRA